MVLKTERIDIDLAQPLISPVTYDQTRQYHPFAIATGEGEWTVQPPNSRPIGIVRQVTGSDGTPEFAVWHLTTGGDTVAFEETHPTLFHAVAWLRWRLGAHAE